jgi:alpha-1,2-rhamnosyltransferase
MSSSNNLAYRKVPKRILWDCSYIDREPWRESGIQRVVRELGNAVIRQASEQGIDVVIVSLSEPKKASGPLWQLKAIPSPKDKPLGQPRTLLDPERGDLLVVADSTWHLGIGYRLADWWERGMSLVVVQHDVVPLSHPETTDAGQVRNFSLWMLEVATFADALVGVSRSTSNNTLDLLKRLAPWRDFDGKRMFSCWLAGEHARQGAMRYANGQQGPVVALGTIEPRKNYPVLLDAFELHWARGGSIPLLIIGRYGWRAGNTARRIEQLQSAGRPLTWMQDASDREVWQAIGNSMAFVSMSVEEGFDLPSTEAGVNGVPLILSDIPVHRELFANYARFVSPSDPASLARLLDEIECNGLQNPEFKPPILSRTWGDAADELIEILSQVTPDPAIRTAWKGRFVAGEEQAPSTKSNQYASPLQKKLINFGRSFDRNSTAGKLIRLAAALAKMPGIRREIFSVARRADLLENLVGELESKVAAMEIEISGLRSRETDLLETVKYVDALAWTVLTNNVIGKSDQRIGLRDHADDVGVVVPEEESR